MAPDNNIERLAENWGADFFGVAELYPARDEIFEQGGAVIAEYPRAISIGIALLDTIVDQLPQRAERAVAINYQHHGYDLINQRLDLISSRLSSVIQSDGYKALPVPASKTIDDEKLVAAFSHKMGAHLAGLGWIGKNCLLITPERGPRVRWATILTDAPLKVTEEAMEDDCGDCQKCVEICPVNAFTGQPFREHEAREARFDAGKCDRYLTRLEEQNQVGVCGLCLYICPYGRQ